MTADQGFVFTGRLDSKGGAVPVAVSELAAGRGDGLVEWVHLDITKDAAREWLARQPDLPELACEGLLATETEPRLADFDDGVLMILREVNTHKDNDPDDMISLRLWIGRDRIITARLRHLAAIEDIKNALSRAAGPRSTCDFICAVGHRMALTKTKIIAALAAELDDIDEDLAREDNLADISPRIADLRRRAIRLQRYFRPQRAVFGELADYKAPWGDDQTEDELDALAAEFARLAGDIDSILSRAQVTQDELRSLETARASRISLTLTVVAAIFLPITFVTGLLGMNVGGIPLAETDLGFWVVTGVIAALGVGLWLFFRTRRYL